MGNYNKMLWIGLFYDQNTQCYYADGRYFNTVTDQFMDGISDPSLFSNKNPFLEEGVMPVDTEYINELAMQWAESLLSSNNHGIYNA